MLDGEALSESYVFICSGGLAVKEGRGRKQLGYVG
jgi:hypothetical protein